MKIAYMKSYGPHAWFMYFDENRAISISRATTPNSLINYIRNVNFQIVKYRLIPWMIPYEKIQ